MPEVTVSAGHGTTVSVPIQSLENAKIAAQALAGVSQGVDDGTITPYDYSGFGLFTPPAGASVMFLTGPGAVSIPGGTGTVVDISWGPDMLFGGSAAQQLVVSGLGGITYYANSGAGTVIAGGGNNTIITAPNGGDHLILTSDGDNQILALSGNDTISAGPGHNSIVLGTGADSVLVTGHDTIAAGSGADTVDVVCGHAVVYGGSGSLVFANGDCASTVFAGTGSATINGGFGGGVFYGGLGGNNLITGGDLASTLFGGGNGDQLFAVGRGHDLVVAGAGNETLAGLGNGADTFEGGSGNDVITGGDGRNTIVAGSGADTLTGGPDGNDYEFINGKAGGTVVITNFAKGTDELTLQGYATDALSNALEKATVSGGSTTITLPDNTTITFLGVTDLGGLAGGGDFGDDYHNHHRFGGDYGFGFGHFSWNHW